MTLTPINVQAWTQVYVAQQTFATAYFPASELGRANLGYAEQRVAAPWWLRAWTRTEDSQASAAPAFAGDTFQNVVNASFQWSPLKLEVLADGGAFPDQLLVDLAEGICVMVPPSRRVTINVVGPSELVMMNDDVQPRVATAFGQYYTSIIALSMSSQRSNVAQRRRNTLTRMVDIAAAAFESIPIPPHTIACWVSPAYNPAPPDGGAALIGIPSLCAWQHRTIGGGGQPQGPIASFGVSERSQRPNLANHIYIGADPLARTGATVVFELEV